LMVTEKLQLNCRTEFFNLFNTPQFGGGMNGLDTNANSPTFGQIASSSQSNEPRIGQFSLKLRF
jgi:hypothetical protein